MTFGRNHFNCECGGLRHICRRWGCLPGSIEHYKAKRQSPVEYDVVWSGALQRTNATMVQLLPDRAEHSDTRMAQMPTFDLDEGEVVEVKPRRRYTLTGKHIGKFSRTNPEAPHYKPTIRPDTSGLNNIQLEEAEPSV